MVSFNLRPMCYGFLICLHKQGLVSGRQTHQLRYGVLVVYWLEHLKELDRSITAKDRNDLGNGDTVDESLLQKMSLLAPGS